MWPQTSTISKANFYTPKRSAARSSDSIIDGEYRGTLTLRCVCKFLVNVKELTNPAWIKAKGLLFLSLGLLSGGLLLFERPTLRVAALLLLAVWSFCRFYYFAFHVLERYVDPTFRFSGLLSLVRYLRDGGRPKP
ncbi:MAG TPA: hypothetical protein VEI73_17275 [Candidatus Acidoferrum sp.]|nr:hypothetical protein [Candidatus Acidoferrum sp.]